MSTPALITLGYLNRGLLTNGATWTASSAVPTRPALHLGTRLRTDKWRSVSPEDQWIKCKLPSALAIACGALIESNLTIGATVRFQGNATDSWGAPTVDEPFAVWDQSHTKVLLKLIVETALPWWRWTIDDPDNPDEYIEIGVGFLSPRVTFLRGPTDYSVTRRDPSLTGQPPGGSPRSWVLPKRWRVRWLQREIDHALLYGALGAAYDALGTSEDGVCAVFSTNPDADAAAHGTNVYGRFEVMPETVFATGPDRYRGPMAFLETR